MNLCKINPEAPEFIAPCARCAAGADGRGAPFPSRLLLANVQAPEPEYVCLGCAASARAFDLGGAAGELGLVGAILLRLVKVLVLDGKDEKEFPWLRNLCPGPDDPPFVPPPSTDNF